MKRWPYGNLEFHKVPVKFLSSDKLITVSEWEKPPEGALEKGITGVFSHKIRRHFLKRCWDLI